MDHNIQSILLTSLSCSSTSAKKERLENVLTDDWLKVAELARQHSVLPLLYHNLKSLNLSLPENIAVQLKEQYLKQAFRNTFLYRELGKLLIALNEKAIPVILLKGAYLAEAVYANIGLRGMSDVDLLVKKEDLPRVEEELLALGGEPEDCNRLITEENAHFAYKLPEQGLRVEIHWSIISAAMPCCVDVEGLWDRAQPFLLGQKPALALCPEDLLLHLCLHMAKHASLMNIRMLCDIGEVVKHFDNEIKWEVIGERAKQWGVSRAVYVMLAMSKDMLKVKVPSEWLSSIKPAELDEDYLTFTRELITENHIDTSINGAAMFWKAEGLSGKLAMIKNRLLLPRDAMALIYPSQPRSWRIYLYYPVRFKYLLFKYGSWIWRLIRGESEAIAKADESNKITEMRKWLLSG